MKILLSLIYWNIFSR